MTTLTTRRHIKQAKPLANDIAEKHSEAVRSKAGEEAKENQTSTSPPGLKATGKKKNDHTVSITKTKVRTVLGELSASEVQLRSAQHSQTGNQLNEEESDNGERRRLGEERSTDAIAARRITTSRRRPSNVKIVKSCHDENVAPSSARKNSLRQHLSRRAAEVVPEPATMTSARIGATSDRTQSLLGQAV
jgi:hypothetical protein